MSENTQKKAPGKSGLVDMTKGSPMGHIVRFSLPLLFGNVFQQLYNVVDTMVVGRVMGTDAQVAVSNAMPIIFLTVALFVGLGMGASVILSQNFGAGEMDTVRSTIRTLVTAVMAVSVPLTVLGVLFAPQLLSLLNVPDVSFEMSRIYLVVIFCGLLGSFGYNINAGILQGLGDSKTPVIFLVIACLLNIGLDIALVFPLGVAGVALATIIAQAASWLFGVWYIRRKYPELELNPLKFGIDGPILRRAIRIGLPAGIQQSLFSVGMILMQRLVNHGDGAFIAGFGSANKIDTFVFMPVWSFMSALTTFTGQNMGMRQIDRVKKGLRASLLLCLVTFVALGAVSLLLGRQLLSLFNTDPAVVSAGMYYLYEVIPFSIIVFVSFMFTAVLRGSGASMFPMIVTLVAFCGVRIPTAYLYEYLFGLNYIYFSYPTGWAVGTLMGLAAYLRGGWKTKSLVLRADGGEATAG